MDITTRLRCVGERTRKRIASADAATKLWWVLRIAAATCFVGHGAFGIIGKVEWLPFFAAAGISADTAWILMPVIGAVDIALGLSVLFAPRRIVLVYMAIWAVWTAFLRPMTGDSLFELLERAGNYGVPIAMLLLLGPARSVRELLAPVHMPALAPARVAHARLALMWTTVLLLIGHGALAAIVQKPLYAAHMEAIGLSSTVAIGAGWLELGLALTVLAYPRVTILLAIVVWKLGTEMLFPIAGAPVWEFIERGGSYGAPLALAFLVQSRPILAPGARLAAKLAPVLLGMLAITMTAEGQSSTRAGSVRDTVTATPERLRLEGAELVSALRRGGLVLFFRHTTTDHEARDRGSAREQQRNLTAAGEHEARAIGEAIRELGIPVGEVRASYMYRTRETAELAFGRVQIDSSLRGRGSREGVHAQLIAPVPSGTNRAVLTHNGTMISVLEGHEVGRIAEGDIIIVEPLGDGTFRVIGHLTVQDWRTLTAREDSRSVESAGPFPDDPPDHAPDAGLERAGPQRSRSHPFPSQGVRERVAIRPSVFGRGSQTPHDRAHRVG